MGTQTDIRSQIYPWKTKLEKDMHTYNISGPQQFGDNKKRDINTFIENGLNIISFAMTTDLIWLSSHISYDNDAETFTLAFYLGCAKKDNSALVRLSSDVIITMERKLLFTMLTNTFIHWNYYDFQ